MTTKRRPAKPTPFDAAVAQGIDGARRAIAARASRRGRRSAKPRGLLVAEGDSWFDYPFFDVLERLEDRFGYTVESVAHKGDTVEQMAYDGQQLSKLARLFERLGRERRTPLAALLSGGGNDVAGEEFKILLNHRASRLPTLNDRVVQGVLEDRLRYALVTLIAAVTELSRRYFGRAIPVLLHGYDYPVPDGRGYLGGFGPLPGPWLEPGFRRKGYGDPVERRSVMVEVIDRFNAVLAQLPRQPGFAHVTHVDLRGTLSGDPKQYKKWWNDELHPTAAGFERVAARFDAALR